MCSQGGEEGTERIVTNKEEEEERKRGVASEGEEGRDRGVDSKGAEGREREVASEGGEQGRERGVASQGGEVGRTAATAASSALGAHGRGGEEGGYQKLALKCPECKSRLLVKVWREQVKKLQKLCFKCGR